MVLKQIMKNGLVVGLFAATTTGINAQPTMTLKDIVEGEYAQQVAPIMHSLNDGIHYISANPEKTMIIKYAYKSGLPTDTLFNVSTARECTFDFFDGYSLSDNEQQLLIYTDSESIYRHSFKAKYYTFEIRRNLVKPLTEGLVQSALFSPNGRMVAFVRANNIFLKKLDYGTESQLTKDGKYNQIINGLPDWVYEEEFAMTQAMTWSEDSEHLAYLKFDETPVKEYSMQMFKGLAPEKRENSFYPTSFRYKYPVAGETNATVDVFTFNVPNRTTKKIQLPLTKEDYIPRIVFTKDANKLAVMTLNRQQNLFRLYFANPASGVSKLILQDENEAYIGASNMDDIVFYPTFFTFVSEKSGYRHLYQYGMTGSMMRQVTRGDWDMMDFAGYDPKTQSFYIQAAKKSPLQREVYRVDKKGTLYAVATKAGYNTAHFSKNFDYYQLYHQSVKEPMYAAVYNRKGQEVRVLEDNTKLKELLASVKRPEFSFFTFTTPEDDTLNGYMLKPVDFDATRRYPVVMVQYGGPGSQQVLDRFKVDWTSYLASNGYLVVCVDGRGTGARGADFERTTYMKLGVKESQDQIYAAHYLGELPFVDPSRIAIWGWSFGGYNTLMSMTGSDCFKAGIAVAPVTDWRFYDTIYTERYMRKPQENNDGYEASSVIARAGKLKGNLLIVTGTADDNVHPQNTLELTEAFVQENVLFDMQVYTNRNHFINGGNTSYHLYQTMVNYLDRHLK